MERKVTMESIAGELGVSKSAVSKALNGKADISKELRDTILRKAKELHYSKAPFYHILVLSAARYFGKNGSYYQQLVRMLQEALGALGHTCELRRVSEEEEARGLTLSDGELFSADGLIVLGGLACERIEDLQALGLPILLFDYYTNKLDIDWVTPNDYFNAYTLTDFLIARGHTEIGFCGNTRMTSGMQDRFLGYQKALLENGVLLHPEWVMNDRAENGRDIPLALPDRLPTAYLCVCDKTAYRLVNALAAAGVRVPEDVAVVTFDDSAYSRRCSPRLTTISVEKDQLINRCIDLLLKKIRTDGYREHVFLSGKIRVRDSC